MKKRALKQKYVDYLGRSWETDMGDIEVGDEVRTGSTIVKITDFDPAIGSGTAQYEWISSTGEKKKHQGLPPLKCGTAYHSETKERGGA